MKTVEHFIEKFVPENYNIFLDINRQEKTFSGNVAISGEALETVVSFHQKDLDVHSVLLDNQELVYHMDHDNEAFHVEVAETGIMTLVVEFSGKITDNMTGIYPSYYTLAGEKKEIISTQFESHFAREAFPNIDEPEAKATFDLAIKCDQTDQDLVLSNMPEINADRRQETGVWTFETTPRMSSYLLAFALGELKGKKAFSKNGTEVGVFSTVAQADKSVDFALDIAVRIIDFYEDYFQVKYPIPQSYHVALPDFSAGAMENWGLVTYREVYLLVDDNSTASSRQQVALVVAHELAHQWFGNLVTMKWWDDLWLNESFANMMEYVSVDAIEPSWNIFEDFQTSGVPAALKRDATDGVQSVHVEVNHPDEINTLFDAAIVYAKGSRLMHMLRRWLGDEDFSAGLKTYFEKHQYGNTIGRDLWHALSDSSGKDVASFMDGWLEQPGYPLVQVSLDNDQLRLSQSQFFIGEHEEQGRLWQIPLNSNWTGIPEILTEKEIVIDHFSDLAKANQENGPLRLNTDNTAHYLSDYQGQLLDDLLAQFDQLDKTTKLQVIQERRLLAESGRISYADLVTVLAMLLDEPSYMVTAASAQLIDGLERFIEPNSSEEISFKALVKKVNQKNFERFGFEKVAGENDEAEMTRQLTLSQMIYADDETAAKKAQAIFEAYRQDIEAIPAPIRATVLVNQMKQAETDELISLYLNAYIQTNDGTFKRQLATALSYTQSSEHLNHILLQWKNKDTVKPQDLSLWYRVFLAKPFAQETVWTWARNEWDWIKERLGGDMSFDAFVLIPAALFKTTERLEEYKAFFEPQLNDRALSRNITMGIKDISARIALIESNQIAVKQAISENA